MGIKTQKVLRLISKIILLVIGLVLIGYVGLVVYKSTINKPQRVRITNVTDSAATITWVTDNPVRGIVYYKDKDSVLAGPFGFLFSKVGYDDRDFAVAQEDCVNAFNENAKNTKDENFAVSGENFDCENIKVEKLGAYYTHSVTVKNLNENSTYYFKVGNGILSWGINGVGKEISEDELPLATDFSFVTGTVSETVPTPNIAYGTVFAGSKTEEGYLTEALSKDSLVFAYLVKEGANSQLISTVTNTDGGWVLDKSNLRDTEGKLISDLTGATMQFCAQYEDVAFRGCVEVVDSLDEDTTVDLLGNVFDDLTTYEKNWILQKFEELVGKVYAVEPNPVVCPSEIPPVTDDTTYTCDRDCSKVAFSVSGCDTNASCMKKCTHVVKTKYGTWENTDWVNYGTVADGVCSLPEVCGCTPGACENKPSCNHITCQSGHYWSGTQEGSCPNTVGIGCSGESTNPCEGQADGHQCGSDKICDNEQCVDDESNGGEEEGDNCGSIGNNMCTANKKKKCTLLGTFWKLVTVNPSQCPATPTEYCKGGATKVGECAIDGKYCSTNGGTLVYGDNRCRCKETHGTSATYTNPNICLEGTPFTRCKLNPEKTSVTAGPDNQCTSTNVPTCSVNPEYVHYVGSNYCDLKSCNVVCDGTITANYPTPAACRNKYTNTAEKIPYNSNCDSAAENTPVNFENIDINKIGEEDLKALLDEYQTLRGTLEETLKGYLGALDNRDCKATDLNNLKTIKNADKLCKVLAGEETKLLPVSGAGYCKDGYKKIYTTCSGYSTRNINLVSKAYAQDNASDGYTLYLPEYGMFSFQLGDYDLETTVNGKETYYIFYIEANGTDGFQMPADPDNPTTEEDIMLKSNSAQITYKKVSSAQKYTIVKGINLVSFNFVPVATTLGAYTAKDIIAQGKKDGVTIKYISTFDGGRWNSGYSCLEGACTGNNFTIVPGKGYIIYSTTGGSITIPGYSLTSAVPVPFSAGWNLVGIHGYSQAYTARSLITSINKIQGLTANNISWWPTSKAKYEGLQVDGETTYGLDFPISPTNGYFVRISKFAPTDNKCKSIIWQATNGKLSGVCGNTK